MRTTVGVPPEVSVTVGLGDGPDMVATPADHISLRSETSLRVLVYPHDLQIGGSQINAIEIAARLRRWGHECILFGQRGPLVDRAEELGLEFEPSPEPGRRPSLTVARHLAGLIRERGIDVVHGYEWPPIMESWWAARRASSAVAVGTVMSMAVAPFLPRGMTLTVGTEQIAAAERQHGRGRVNVIEPPVDLVENRPSVSGAAFRAQWGVAADELLLVVVTRLAHQLKLEGVLTAIQAVGRLPENLRGRVRLAVVGDGSAAGEVRVVANRVNAAAAGQGQHRPPVILTGLMSDPRPAYAAADVVLGMGGSALRGLAFGKPLVVQGEDGFWQLLTPETVDEFLWAGWYGVGDDPSGGVGRLLRELGLVLSDPARRQELGTYGRQLVDGRFGLDGASHRQLAVYRAALGLPAEVSMVEDAVRSGVGFARYTASRKVSRLIGRFKVDDFNSRPVARSGPSRPERSGQ